jgi:hypothetical protein
MIGIATTTGWLLLAVVIAATGAWGALALSISGPQPEALRTLLAAAFALASVAVLVAIALNRRRWRTLSAWLVLFLGVLAWWATLRPSNDRDWLPNVARLPWASVEGNIVTVHNIRNFTYRSENDFTPAWYDKSYDLSKLEGVDVIAVYWMGPDIAHVFVSFAFVGGDHLAVSIETRTEKGEGYSTVKGFFRQYELYYVVADERDVIGLRTNYRRDPPEDVYVYRLKSTPQGRQRFFLEYINQINALKDKPEFYNSLTTNCTTNIWMNARVNPSHLPFSWKILASGHVPEFIYENGGLDDAGRPFAELQRRAHVNERAHGAGITANFSQNIRRAQ